MYASPARTSPSACPLSFIKALQVHIGLVVPNFYRAEHDPLASDVLIYDGYQIQDGFCAVPDAPGFGLAIDENKFGRVRVNFELTA